MPRMERIGDTLYSAEDIEFWSKELYKRALQDHDFTPWEVGFISSIHNTIAGGHPPSELQSKTLKAIYESTFD